MPYPWPGSQRGVREQDSELDLFMFSSGIVGRVFSPCSSRSVFLTCKLSHEEAICAMLEK